MGDQNDYIDGANSSLKYNVEFDVKNDVIKNVSFMTLPTEQENFIDVSKIESQETFEYFIELLTNEGRSINSKNETGRHNLNVISMTDWKENSRLSRDSVSIDSEEHGPKSIDSVLSFLILNENRSISSPREFGKYDAIDGTGNRFLLNTL